MGRSTTDVSMVSMEEWERMSWRTLEDLSSDHIPILITWNREIRVNKRVRRTKLNIKMGDREKYKQLVQRGVENVEKEMEPPRKLEMLTEIMNNAAKESCPTRVVRRECVSWMNAEIKQLKKSRNKTRRDRRRKDRVDNGYLRGA